MNVWPWLIWTALAIIASGYEDVYLNYDGDIKLGALFPIHKNGGSGGGDRECGEIQKEDGIQPLEAMLFTLDEINRSQKLLPGIRLGAVAVDSCDNPIHAAEKAIPLLKGFMTRKVELSCNESNFVGRANDIQNDNWPCGNDVVGIVGPQTSAVSMQIANLGRIFKVPQVSLVKRAVVFTGKISRQCFEIICSSNI